MTSCLHLHLALDKVIKLEKDPTANQFDQFLGKSTRVGCHCLLQIDNIRQWVL